MNLGELKPSMTGDAKGINWLSFTCPKCGEPYEINIRCKLNGPADAATATWAWTFPEGVYGLDKITVTPSINNAHHGRKKQCGYHFSIVGGELIPPP